MPMQKKLLWIVSDRLALQLIEPMKYNIAITGGFAGFIEEYSGSLALDKQQEKDLKVDLKKKTLPKNKNLRDSILYELYFEFEDETIDVVLNEFEVSSSIQNLIHMIKKENQY